MFGILCQNRVRETRWPGEALLQRRRWRSFLQHGHGWRGRSQPLFSARRNGTALPHVRAVGTGTSPDEDDCDGIGWVRAARARAPAGTPSHGPSPSPSSTEGRDGPSAGDGGRRRSEPRQRQREDVGSGGSSGGAKTGGQATCARHVDSGRVVCSSAP